MKRTPTGRPLEGAGSQQDLEQRLQKVGARDTTRGFLFSTALELVKNQEGEAAHQRCVEAAGGHSFTAFFSYPLPAFLRLAYTASWELSAHYGGFDEALQNLGFRSTPRFLDSSTGRLLLSLVSKEPQRLFENLPGAYRAAWEHGGCHLKWLGPQHGQLHYQTVVPVPYFTGSVLQICAAAHLRGHAQGHQHSLTECWVDFTWE